MVAKFWQPLELVVLVAVYDCSNLLQILRVRNFRDLGQIKDADKAKINVLTRIKFKLNHTKLRTGLNLYFNLQQKLPTSSGSSVLFNPKNISHKLRHIIFVCKPLYEVTQTEMWHKCFTYNQEPTESTVCKFTRVSSRFTCVTLKQYVWHVACPALFTILISYG